MRSLTRSAIEHDRTSLQPLDGDVHVLCTFDYQPAERMTLEYPGCEASVCVTSVSINGHEVDAGVFDKRVIDRWEADILAEVTAAQEDARAYADEARFQQMRDDELMERFA